MYFDTTFPPPDAPLAGLMRELNALGSTDIGAAIDAMIAHLDQASGDPDLEECGLEDSFVAHAVDGPGCPIADAGGDTSDDRDASFPEWTWWSSRNVQFEQGASAALQHEDAEMDDEPEDDDPAGGNILDERHDEEPDREDDDSAARQVHRDRIRETRCECVRVGYAPHGWWEYQLRGHSTDAVA